MSSIDAALIEAHRLARLIEMINAKREAAAGRWRRYPQEWTRYYDPHAAHELGELIFATMDKVKP